ncbi:L,D-transpeptidase [Anaerolinea thermophila]|uniref:L,D-TPase catalytic domain-containing protein n=1 Tax=Anaerolinea thermophila (strain DSM 14523 / JCM 11388 / NBRC 100420 / UNI-1) TaxID=926569 RepID=E8N590_ANATU|nr:L,D-transpeptidase [Anaerolinea thermophila]BAJ63604.1 hypothetical protein ANT_15760 [Anaerolinea thermophila UNI-1]
MKKNEVSRRDFLKLIGLGLGSLAFRPFLVDSSLGAGGDIFRVATYSVSVYKEPNDKSPILYQRYRDELINVYEEVISPYGPGYNPIWYRVWRGYVHSARLQKVKFQTNPVIQDIPKGGRLAEVTVPFTQSMRYLPWQKKWEPVYRLYFESTHWVTGVEQGPDGRPWYRIHDELLEFHYFVPAEHLRLIPDEEFTPISPQVKAWEKTIDVSIARQELICYEGGKEVLRSRVSTGVSRWNPDPTSIPTETPTGEFHIFSKMPSKHMGNGQVTADIEAYELVGVPWTSFFVETGVAIHGTFWHRNWGTPMSRGCVNVPTDIAKWIFRWTTPICEPGVWEQKGYGTLVVVH